MTSLQRAWEQNMLLHTLQEDFLDPIKALCRSVPDRPVSPSKRFLLTTCRTLRIWRLFWLQRLLNLFSGFRFWKCWSLSLPCPPLCFRFWLSTLLDVSISFPQVFFCFLESSFRFCCCLLSSSNGFFPSFCFFRFFLASSFFFFSLRLSPFSGFSPFCASMACCLSSICDCRVTISVLWKRSLFGDTPSISTSGTTSGISGSSPLSPGFSLWEEAFPPSPTNFSWGNGDSSPKTFVLGKTISANLWGLRSSGGTSTGGFWTHAFAAGDSFHGKSIMSILIFFHSSRNFHTHQRPSSGEKHSFPETKAGVDG